MKVFQGGVGTNCPPCSPHAAALCSRPGWAVLALATRHWSSLFSWRLGFYQKLTGLSCFIRAAVLLLMVFCSRLWAEMWIVIVLGPGTSGRPLLGSASPVGSPWNAAPRSHAGMGPPFTPVVNTHTPTAERSEAISPFPRGAAASPAVPHPRPSGTWPSLLTFSGLPWDTLFLCSAASQLRSHGLC